MLAVTGTIALQCDVRLTQAISLSGSRTYSSLISAALMTAALRSVSSIRNLVTSAGVCRGTSTLIWRMRAFISSVLAISTTLAFSLLTISAGVPAGAQIEYQPGTSASL